MQDRRSGASFYAGLWLAVVLGGLAHLACGPATTAIPDFDPEGKLLFIEDVDGRGGLMSFNFGDIMIFDPQTRTKTRLTRDKYFDYHPYWSSDGQKIIFESKRIDSNRDGIYDLSDERHLFILDIASGRIEQFDRDFEHRYEGVLGRQNSKPAWSPQSNKLAFVTRLGRQQKIVLMDLETEQVTDLTGLNEFVFIDRLRWSPDERFLAFDEKIELFTNGIVVIRIATLEQYFIGDPARFSRLGSWSKDGSRILFDSFPPGEGIGGFYEYSLKTGETTSLYEFSDIRCGNPQSGNSDIIYATGGSVTSLEGDIWLYNVAADSLSRLTTDGKEKSGLLIYQGN